MAYDQCNTFNICKTCSRIFFYLKPHQKRCIPCQKAHRKACLKKAYDRWYAKNKEFKWAYDKSRIRILRSRGLTGMNEGRKRAGRGKRDYFRYCPKCNRRTPKSIIAESMHDYLCPGCRQKHLSDYIEKPMAAPGSIGLFRAEQEKKHDR